MDMADRDKLIEYVFPDGRLPVMTQVFRGTVSVCQYAQQFQVAKCYSSTLQLPVSP